MSPRGLCRRAAPRRGGAAAGRAAPAPGPGRAARTRPAGHEQRTRRARSSTQADGRTVAREALRPERNATERVRGTGLTLPDIRR
ncbi:hypothetical protein [Streptomyces sp. bgisy159]|uniref:hypothetical protein n=1 Tax=Streptomyces sp. bgisy159 TaxID=3413795 RepID=UPI003F4A755F